MALSDTSNKKRVGGVRKLAVAGFSFLKHAMLLLLCDRKGDLCLIIERYIENGVLATSMTFAVRTV